jgi:hypothetical protein
MPSKHKKDMVKKKHHKKSSKHSSENLSTIFVDEPNVSQNIYNKNVNLNNVINSYPYQNLGYNFPIPSYSVQIKRKPDETKYFRNYRYDYNVQVNKPVMTYDNFIAQETLKNMSQQEYRYYNQMNQQYYIYNGNYAVANNKPIKLALQAGLDFPQYSGGPQTGEINGQMGYTPQPTQSPPSVNPNVISGFNNGNVQIYGNSPAYTGVQAKTLPGQNLIAQQNFIQTQANNANINNPAYFNYGQYYY